MYYFFYTFCTENDKCANLVPQEFFCAGNGVFSHFETSLG